MAKMSELSFVVFLINALSEAWGVITPQVYEVLKKSGAIDQYIVPCYDVLHTCGREYLVDDITGYVQERGYKI